MPNKAKVGDVQVTKAMSVLYDLEDYFERYDLSEWEPSDEQTEVMEDYDGDRLVVFPAKLPNEAWGAIIDEPADVGEMIDCVIVSRRGKTWERTMMVWACDGHSSWLKERSQQ